MERRKGEEKNWAGAALESGRQQRGWAGDQRLETMSSGPGYGTNVSFMWGRPGQVIAFFTRERAREERRKTHHVIKHSGLRFNAGCLQRMRLQLSRFCVGPFFSFDVYLSALVPPHHHHHHPHPYLSLRCCVWLASGARE